MSAIHLYSYNKKINSTSTPISGGLNVSGTFRQPLDLLHPIVRIEDSTTYPFMTNKYNIAHISELNRWYWIRNVVWITDKIAELHLDVDVLSTYKTEIGNSTQFVLRSASAFNGSLVDNLYPVESPNNCIVSSIASDIPWYDVNGWKLANGYYIVGILNKDINAVGSTSFYCLNDKAFQNVRYTLFNSTAYTNISFPDSGLSEQMYKSLFNPMQYISSVMWFPIKPDVSGLYNISTLSFGFFSITLATGSECYRLTNFVKSGSSYLNNVKHPSATTRGEFLNAAPFLKRTLYIPPVGSIELDTSKITSSTAYPMLYWYVDFITGEVRIIIMASGNDNPIIGDAVGQLGINVSLAQSAQNIVGWANNVASASAGGLTALTGLLTGNGGMVTSGLSSAANGIANAASALAPNVSSVAGKGGLLNGDIIPYDQTSLVYPSNDDNTNKGRPYCNAVQLNSLSGYILCSGAHIAISGALLEEQQMIDNFLNTGFYYV